MTERVAIVGSRAHPALDLVRAYVRSLPNETIVCSGGAEGVDKAAVQEAMRLSMCTYEFTVVRERRFLVRVYRASSLAAMCQGMWYEFPLHGDASYADAFRIRNTLLAQFCTRGAVWPDGSKGGAWDWAREGQRFRRDVKIHWADGRVEPFGKSMQRRIAVQVGE